MRIITRETFKAVSPSEIQALLPAEIQRVNELKEAGILQAMYTAADNSAAWLVWNVENKAAFEAAHQSLPLHPLMNSEITTLVDKE